MSDFLRFFDKVAYKYKLHLSIAYNKVADWGIYIYRSGRGENGKDLVIVMYRIVTWSCALLERR